MIGWGNQNWVFDTPEAHLDLLRIMVNEGQYDPMEKGNHHIPSFMHKFIGSPTVYRWLLDQEEFVVDFEQKAYDEWTIPAALLWEKGSNASRCLELVFANRSDPNNFNGSQSNHIDADRDLPHRAALVLRDLADNVDFPNRVKVLWDAGFDFLSLSNSAHGTTLECLFTGAMHDLYETTKHNRYRVERQSIPPPPLRSMEDVIEYDRLENNSNIKSRSRTSKSLWRTWYPGNELSILEKVQRHLDSWMEVLLEAGLDLVDYGRREDELHPEGLFSTSYGEARAYFEYGDHVSGCRIHVTEIWTYSPDFEEEATPATPAEPSTIPGGWNCENA